MNGPDLLREAFEARTAQLGVAPDALETIRGKVVRRARARRRAAVAVIGLATVAIVSGLAVAVAVRPAPAPTVGDGPSTVVTSPPTAAPVTSAVPAPAVTATVPVYFSGPGSMLYREFVATTVPSADLATLRAVELSVAGRAADPDYRSRWPAGTVVQRVSQSEDLVWINLSNLPTAAGADPLAVQQLVYTVTAVAADRGDPVAAVRLTIDEQPVPGGERLVRAAATDTLAPLWLISPQQGATVGGTFEVSLAGAVFEATARLRVRDSSGAVIRDEQVMLDRGAPERGAAQASLTLPPGRYTVEVYFVSLADGSERGLDGHDITVT